MTISYERAMSIARRMWRHARHETIEDIVQDGYMRYLAEPCKRPCVLRRRLIDAFREFCPRGVNPRTQSVDPDRMTHSLTSMMQEDRQTGEAPPNDPATSTYDDGPDWLDMFEVVRGMPISTRDKRIVLARVAGASYEIIAEAAGVSKQRAEVIMTEARRAVREYLISIFGEKRCKGRIKSGKKLAREE